jgi:hypothetical protein
MSELQTLSAIVPQLLSDGLTLGFVYAIVALGYTMVYGILEFINFAHSELFMFGAFAGTEILLLLQSQGFLTGMPPTLMLIIAIVFAMVVTGLLGVGVDRIAYKPVRNAPKLVPFISAIGVSFILQDTVRMAAEIKNGSFYLYAPSMFSNRIQITPSMAIPEKTLYIVIFCVIIMLALGLIMAVVFQLAHINGDAAFPSPVGIPAHIENEWAVHQVETTADFAPHNQLLNFYIGGLNYQIEHHLLPHICHMNYPRLAPIVRATCEEYGVRYTCYPTWREAFACHLKQLRILGHEPAN